MRLKKLRLQLLRLQVFDKHDFIAGFAVDQFIDDVLRYEDPEAARPKPLLFHG